MGALFITSLAKGKNLWCCRISWGTIWIWMGKSKPNFTIFLFAWFVEITHVGFHSYKEGIATFLLILNQNYWRVLIWFYRRLVQWKEKKITRIFLYSWRINVSGFWTWSLQKCDTVNVTLSLTLSIPIAPLSTQELWRNCSVTHEKLNPILVVKAVPWSDACVTYPKHSAFHFLHISLYISPFYLSSFGSNRSILTVYIDFMENANIFATNVKHHK